VWEHAHHHAKKYGVVVSQRSQHFRLTLFAFTLVPFLERVPEIMAHTLAHLRLLRFKCKAKADQSVEFLAEAEKVFFEKSLVKKPWL